MTLMNRKKNILPKLHALLLTVALLLPFTTTATAENRHSYTGKTLKILAIGNSFSEDAVEQHLYELAAAEGIEVIIGNLYHGGCSLEQHYDYLKGDKPEYNYRKVVGGVKTDRPQTTLDYALDDEDWDYVSFQQASHFSGLKDTYSPYLERVVDHVVGHIRPDTQLMWHMTWAYAASSGHEGFKNYGNSQRTMYNAIVEATQYAMKLRHFDILIPCGTTIQNARTSYLGDTLCRDGYHLQLVYGRYAAACTWFEAIFNRSAVGNPYTPSGVDDRMKRTIQRAAHKAVKRPFKVSRVR